MAPVILDQRAVCSLDPTVEIKVLAEVGTRDRLACLSLDKSLIWFAHNAIAIGVCDQEAERDIAMGLTVAVDILCVESYNFSTGHSSKLRRHAIATESDGSDRARAA